MESTTIAAAAAVTAFTTLVPPPSNATLAAPARVAVEPTTVDVPAIARVPTTRVDESRLLVQPIAEQTRSRIELPADLSVGEVEALGDLSDAKIIITGEPQLVSDEMRDESGRLAVYPMSAEDIDALDTTKNDATSVADNNKATTNESETNHPIEMPEAPTQNGATFI